jgi:hypothetical protein
MEGGTTHDLDKYLYVVSDLLTKQAVLVSKAYLYPKGSRSKN